MSSLRLANLPALRKQQIMSEFTGLKQACPSGVFATLTPGDSTLWSAVLFVRHGPYAPAILRFQIIFPDTYPRRPPMIIFTTDIFHPLITPLTTYMYTTYIQDNGTVSATDDQRLPPGGLSLRHGFPDWFQHLPPGRTAHQAAGAASASTTSPAAGQTSAFTSPEAGAAAPAGPCYMRTDRPAVSMYQVLQYVKSTFDNPDVLDSVPLDAAGNPGAWHAWRTHRRKQQAKPSSSESAAQQQQQQQQQTGGGREAMPRSPSPQKLVESDRRLANAKESVVSRKPGEWNWDGVWEDRVKKGVVASLSEPIMYGSATGNDELIRFLSMSETEADSVKENLLRTLASTPS